MRGHRCTRRYEGQRQNFSEESFGRAIFPDKLANKKKKNKFYWRRDVSRFNPDLDRHTCHWAWRSPRGELQQPEAAYNDKARSFERISRDRCVG